MQLFDSERKVMEVLWENGEGSASEISKILEEKEGWKRTTTYTMLKKCVQKGYIERSTQGFICKPKITKDEAQIGSVNEEIEKSYHSKTDFFRAYLNKENLTDDEIEELFKIVDDLKK